MRKFSSLLLLLALCVPLSSWADTPLMVFVSVLPQKTFVERIGGDHVKVQVMVKPGMDPHTFEPTPHQITDLANADLYVRLGADFEDGWLKRIQSVKPSLRIEDTSEGISLIPSVEEGEEDEMDPHIWNSPVLVKLMGQHIRDSLSTLDPAHRDEYAANYSSFTAALSQLDGYIHSRLDGLKYRSFMVFHPAWGYFAQTYNLTQVPIQNEGKEPGAHALADLIDLARKDDIHVIFAQPQMSQRSAEEVAKAINGKVEVIDPLAEDYFTNLRHVADLIAAAQPQK